MKCMNPLLVSMDFKIFKYNEVSILSGSKENRPKTKNKLYHRRRGKSSKE